MNGSPGNRNWHGQRRVEVLERLRGRLKELPFSKWEELFKDPMTTAAAIVRLVHRGVILELNITSYRMDAAKSLPPLTVPSPGPCRA